MAWISLGNTDLVEGSTVRGYVYFEYDDASGEPRSCRLRIAARSRYSFTVNFNNITVDGTNYGSQANLTQNSGVFWTGSLYGGRNVTASWTNSWYAGAKTPSITGYIPSAATAPSGGAVSFVSSTWNSVTITSSISSWGTGYTSGTTQLVAGVIAPTATQSDWGGKGRQVVFTPVSASTTSRNTGVTTAGSSSVSGGWPIKGCTDFKLLGGGQTSVGNSLVISSQQYSTPPAPSTLSFVNDGGSSSIVFTGTFAGIAGDNSTSYDATQLTRTIRYKKAGDAGWTYIENQSQEAVDAVSTFNITLRPQETADVEAWQTYKSANSSISTMRLKNDGRIVHFYGGVRELDPQTGTWSNPEAKEVVKLYGSVNGARKKIIKLYGSVNGVAKQVYEDVN